jgi:WD40 repeat protein
VEFTCTSVDVNPLTNPQIHTGISTAITNTNISTNTITTTDNNSINIVAQIDSDIVDNFASNLICPSDHSDLAADLIGSGFADDKYNSQYCGENYEDFDSQNSDSQNNKTTSILRSFVSKIPPMKCWGIRFAAVCVQIAALLILPLVLCYSVQNTDLTDNINDNDDDAVEIASTQKSNPDLPENLTNKQLAQHNQTHNKTHDKNHAPNHAPNPNHNHDALRQPDNSGTSAMVDGQQNMQLYVADRSDQYIDYRNYVVSNTPYEETPQNLQPIHQPIPLTASQDNRPDDRLNEQQKQQPTEQIALDLPAFAHTTAESKTDKIPDENATTHNTESTNVASDVGREIYVETDGDGGELPRKLHVINERVDGGEIGGQVGGEVGGQAEILPYEMRVSRAREQLTEAGKLATAAPERGLALTIDAIKKYKELGQSIPPEARWILGRAYVTQRWGETLVENIPQLENMAVSADGQWLWCHCSDNSVWIWDILRSKKTLGGFKLDAGGMEFVKLIFTPDFRFAIGLGGDGFVRVWNMDLSSSQQSAIVLRGRVLSPIDLQISADGRWLVACGDGNNPNTNVNSNARNTTSNNNQNHNRIAVAGSIQNTFADSAQEAGKSSNLSNAAWLWDLRSINNWEAVVPDDVPEPVILRGHTRPIRVMRISGDSRWLVTGSDDATARLYRLKSNYPGAEQAVLKGHQAAIMSVAFSEKGNWIATGGQDNIIRVWLLPNGNSTPESIELKGHIGWISSLAVDDSGERIVSGSYDNTIRIWSINTKNSRTQKIESPKFETNEIELSKIVTDKIETGKIETGSFDSNKTESGKVEDFAGKKFESVAMNLPQADDSELAAGAVMRVRPAAFTAKRGELVLKRDPVVIQNDQGAVRQLILTRDGKVLISLGSDFSLRLRGLGNEGDEFDPANTMLLRNRSLPITNISITPDNKCLIFNYINQREKNNGGIRIWHLDFEGLIESAELLHASINESATK